MSLVEWAGSRVFSIVHGNNLVYNTCWEDPRLDHQALNLTADDTMAPIFFDVFTIEKETAE